MAKNICAVIRDTGREDIQVKTKPSRGTKILVLNQQLPDRAACLLPTVMFVLAQGRHTLARAVLTYSGCRTVAESMSAFTCRGMQWHCWSDPQVLVVRRHSKLHFKPRLGWAKTRSLAPPKGRKLISEFANLGFFTVSLAPDLGGSLERSPERVRNRAITSL